MRVLICGGRDFHNPKLVKAELDRLHGERKFSLVITGAASGADQSADAWAQSRCLDRVIFPANWRGFGKGAGPRRNAIMLEIGNPALVVAFPGGRGTADMVAKARFIGVEVTEVSP
jgi:hypothetical protein